MRFETYRHIGQHPAAADYAAGGERAASRFDFPPPFPDPDRVFRARVEHLAAARGEALRADRTAVAEAVLAYNRKHTPVPEALAAAERLGDPGALAVVGGQQAGLFTGPMLVIHKAVTILRAARDAERRLGRPVVPVFWIAGEDHDWDEANHTYVVTPQPELRKLEIPRPEGAGRTAVSRTAVDAAAWEAAIGQLGEALQETEFKPDVLDKLRGIAGRSRTLTDFFAGVMSLLFGRRGLVLIDADDPALRAAEGPMFRALAARREELAAALKEGERRTAGLGFPLQAEAAPDGFQLFIFDGGERKLLFVSEDGADAVDKRRTFRMPREALVRLAGERPDLFSNNVLTRPLMQEYLFPVLATVLGPGEIAYWSQLKEAFALFGYSTPVVVPRQQYTLLEGTIQRQMEKFGVTFDDVWRRYGEIFDAWLRAQDEHGVAGRFAAAKASFSEMYRPLLDLASSINPGLKGLGETNLKRILEQIEFMEGKTIDALKARHEAGLRQWERVRLTAAPAGKPQERVVNVFQYIVKYGFRWLEEWIDAAALDFEREWRPHEIVYL